MAGDIFGGILKGLSGFMPQEDPEIKLFQAQTELKELQTRQTELYAQAGKLVMEQEGKTRYPELQSQLELVKSNIAAAEQRLQTIKGEKEAVERAKKKRSKSAPAPTATISIRRASTSARNAAPSSGCKRRTSARAAVWKTRRARASAAGAAQGSGADMAFYKVPCIHCGMLVERDARFCPGCGSTSPFTFLCPTCLRPVKKEERVCSGCGRALHIVCPHCVQTTFVQERCERCGKSLTVPCPNPRCGVQQFFENVKCTACGKKLKK